MTPLDPTRHFGSLQTLRCVAAVMVVILHAPGALRRAGYDSIDTWHAGNGGVDVFFVLSGLVIASSASQVTSSSRASFVVRRAIRIVPLAVAAALLATATIRLGNGDVAILVRSLLFLPTETGTDARFTSSYPAAWTLSYEAFFYLCFAALIGLRPRHRTLATLGLFGALVAIGLLFGHQASGLLDFYTDPIVLEFAAGVGLSRVLGLRWNRVPSTALAVGHLAGWLVLLVLVRISRNDLGDVRFLARGLPAIGIVASAVLLEQRGCFPRVRLIERFGDSSYALYMSHLFVIAALGEAWRAVGLTDYMGQWLLVLAVVAVSLVVGEVVDRVFDRPVRTLLAARLLGGKKATSRIGATP